MKVDSLISSTRQALDNIRLPHQASSLAMNLFRLSHVYRLADDPRVRPMVLRFLELLTEPRFSDLLEQQIEYAMRIAQSRGSILYEEMFKIFSLCNEIHALQVLGLKVEREVCDAYERALRDRFSEQREDARHAAARFLEDWNRDLWWYVENR